jgi:hypothetical protein
VPSASTGQDPRQALSSQAKGTFLFQFVSAANSRRKPEASCFCASRSTAARLRCMRPDRLRGLDGPGGPDGPGGADGPRGAEPPTVLLAIAPEDFRPLLPRHLRPPSALLLHIPSTFLAVRDQKSTHSDTYRAASLLSIAVKEIRELARL